MPKRNWKNHVAACRRELEAITADAKAYFDRVPEEFKAVDWIETDSMLGEHELQALENLCMRVQQTSGKISGVVQRFPVVGTPSSMGGLGVAMKRMVAALRFRLYDHWDDESLTNEDTYVGKRLAGESTDRRIGFKSARYWFAEGLKVVSGTLAALEGATGIATALTVAEIPNTVPPPPRKKRLPTSTVAARRACLRQLLRARNKPTTLGVCKQFDAEHIRVPSKWTREPGIDSWEGAYRSKLKGLVHTLISKEIAACSRE